MRVRFNWIYILLLLGYFIAFFIRTHVTDDPDFGWHVQIGNVIAQQGVPVTDPFSYTMPSYHFVDHEWLTDVILAKVFAIVQIMPLQIFFAILGVVTLQLLTVGADKRWKYPLIFLTAGTLFEFIGVRMQVITWVFLALEMAILYQPSWWKKRFLLPLLFLLWANLHGGFAIGLVILAIFVIGKRIEQRKFLWQDQALLLICIAVTLVNPYGYNLWIEVSKSFTDSSLRWEIQEWYPAIYFTNMTFWIYLILSLFLIGRYWRKFSPTVLCIYLLTLLAGLASMRNIPVFVITAFYPTMQAVAYLSKEASEFKYGKERFKKAYLFFFIMAICFFSPQMGAFLYGVYGQKAEDSSYPTQAVAYLKNNLPSGNIFTSYDWGGFFIWQLPEKQVFIDGRMPSWRNDNAPETESTYAFGDYRSILMNQTPFEQAVNKYNIDMVIMHIDQLKKKKVVILGIDVSKSKLLTKLFTNDMSFSYLTPQLAKLGWPEVYRDKKVIIFKRPETGS